MTHPSNPQAVDLLPQVIEAVTEAGVMLREEFHRPGGPRGTNDHAPVDKEVETLLKQKQFWVRP